VTLEEVDKHNTADCVAWVHRLNMPSHIAQHTTGWGRTIDGQTTRHIGYVISPRIRIRLEEIFAWLKTVGLLRKVRHRGKSKVD